MMQKNRTDRQLIDGMDLCSLVDIGYRYIDVPGKRIMDGAVRWLVGCIIATARTEKEQKIVTIDLRKFCVCIESPIQTTKRVPAEINQFPIQATQFVDINLASGYL